MEVYGVEVEWILFVGYKYKSLNENYMFLNFAKEILLIGNYFLVLLKKQRWNKSWTENAGRRFKLQTTNANKG